MMKTLRERIASKIQVDADGCWLWTKPLDKDGYGTLWAHGHNRQAHRVVYVEYRGEIPEGLTLNHECRVRHCVNPAHLEPMTQRDNVLCGDTLAAANKAKTHCAQGHPYNDVNTRITRAGRRQCRPCTRAWNASRKAVA